MNKKSKRQAVDRSVNAVVRLPKVGEYWWGEREDIEFDGTGYMFKCVAESKWKGKPVFLCVKCNWNTLATYCHHIDITEGGDVYWFNHNLDGGNQFIGMKYFSLCGIRKPNPAHLARTTAEDEA